MRQEALMLILLMSSRDKRPQVQRGGIHADAGVTVWSLSGEVPKLEKKSHCIQQQKQEEDQSHQSGAAE